jgi:hypothetical protein
LVDVVFYQSPGQWYRFEVGTKVGVLPVVMSAKAGIQKHFEFLDSRRRENDGIELQDNRIAIP